MMALMFICLCGDPHNYWDNWTRFGLDVLVECTAFGRPLPQSLLDVGALVRLRRQLLGRSRGPEGGLHSHSSR